MPSIQRPSTAPVSRERQTLKGRQKEKERVPTQKDLLEREKELKQRRASHVNNNFINSNAMSVIAAGHPEAHPEAESNQALHHKSYGKVPPYLAARQKKRLEEEEERRRNAPDPTCPRGMKVMPDEERIGTLRVLQDSQAEARKQLYAFPLAIDTPSQLRYKNKLEAKLKEIEEAILIFDRDRVYIADNDA